MAKTKPDNDWMAKATAARDAIERAADDLLVHAEGLAQLAMMARWRAKNPAAAETETRALVRDDDGHSVFVRNRLPRTHSGGRFTRPPCSPARGRLTCRRPSCRA
ncbi:hypothetical protein SAMN02799622_01843 [Methylobacterium sp. UNC378MF]|uniref:hypothetical protein n=1 Tax=Methylobacterium oryzae TaxID=334852 RepID=UPI00088C9466|nr:hypothetical protein SAMN02799622_01843 [Methylobacterium sp. UNC378MF]